MVARQVLYSGRVQGVGFRASVRSIAQGYDVTGTVRNLPDGRVELQAQTRDSEELEAFLTAIDESDLAGLIKDSERHVMAPLAGLRGFTIVR
jgi:acylphosphatase